MENSLASRITRLTSIDLLSEAVMQLVVNRKLLLQKNIRISLHISFARLRASVTMRVLLQARSSAG